MTLSVRHRSPKRREGADEHWRIESSCAEVTSHLLRRLYDCIPLMPTPITVKGIVKQLNHVDIILARMVVAQFSLEGLLIPCADADIAAPPE